MTQSFYFKCNLIKHKNDYFVNEHQIVRRSARSAPSALFSTPLSNQLTPISQAKITRLRFWNEDNFHSKKGLMSDRARSRKTVQIEQATGDFSQSLACSLSEL